MIKCAKRLRKYTSLSATLTLFSLLFPSQKFKKLFSLLLLSQKFKKLGSKNTNGGKFIRKKIESTHIEDAQINQSTNFGDYKKFVVFSQMYPVYTNV